MNFSLSFSIDFSRNSNEFYSFIQPLDFQSKVVESDKSLLAIDRSDYADDGFMFACIEEHYRVEFLNDKYMILYDLEDVEVEPDDYAIKVELEKM